MCGSCEWTSLGGTSMGSTWTRRRAQLKQAHGNDVLAVVIQDLGGNVVVSFDI